MRRVARALVLASVVASGSVPAPASLVAQAATQPPPMLLAARGDSVRLVLTASPPPFGGFVVYRRIVASGAAFARLTPDPIRRVQQPAVAAGMIGSDLAAVREALGVTDDGDMLRRLQSDRFAGYVLSLVHPQVAVVLGRSFTDRGLQPGASYEYRVVTTDARGEETGPEATAVVRLADRVPPAPTGVEAAASRDGVAVSWQYAPYTGAAGDVVIGFHVYRAEGSAGTPRRVTDRLIVRNDVGPLEWEDTLVVGGAAYRYDVRAVDLLRLESAPSASVGATALDVTAPRMPVAVTAVPGDGVVTVSWEPPSDTDVVGYHVERSTGLDQPFQRLTAEPIGAGSPAYADRAVVGGTAYFYRVLALDGAGNASRPTNALSAVPLDHTPPLPPTDVIVEVRGRTLEVRWAVSPSSDVKGYYVYRGDAPERLVRLVQQPVPATSFVDVGYDGAGLTPGARYTVTVSAVDLSYNESTAASAEILVPDDDPPGVPTAVRAGAVLGRYVEVTWSPSPALDVAGYEVSRGSLSEPAPVVVALTGGQTVARDSTAAAGTTYTYRVVAVDGAGNRSPAAEAVVTFGDGTPPPAPRYVSASLGDAGVAVSWERVVADDLAGYHVYRALVPTGVFERLTDAPLTALTFSDPEGRAEHYYTVRAVDTSANESAPSPAVRGAP